MAVARLGLPEPPPARQFESGYIKTTVFGSSVGFGGTGQPVFIPTSFIVSNAVANLAMEYDLRDASMIYNFGSDVFAGEVRVEYVPEGTGFLLEYGQKDPNTSWELTCNWLAVSVD